MDLKKFTAIVVSAILLGVPPVFAASSQYYAKASVYFNVPSDATFSVGLPSTYSLEAITGTTEGGATATSPSWISFNFTSVPETWVQPRSTGVLSDQQAGAAKPILYIDNTGNVNEIISIRFQNSLPTGITVCANSSCSVTGGCGTATSACTSISTTYVTMATALNSTSFLNITMYGNVSAGTTAGETTAGFLYINSTAA